MTSAVLPNLIAAVLPQAPASAQSTVSTNSARQAFTGLLAAMLGGLPPVTAPMQAATPETEPAGSKQPRQDKSKQQDQSGKAPQKDPGPDTSAVVTLAVPVLMTPSAPLPAVQKAAVDSVPTNSGAAAGTGKEVTGTAEPLPKGQTEDARIGNPSEAGQSQEPFSPAEMPIPQGFAEEAATPPPTVSLPVAPATAGKPSTAEGAVAAAGQSDAVAAVPQQVPSTAELAFAARLTVLAAATPARAVAHAPELHLAMLPEMRTPPGAQEVKTPAEARPTPASADGPVPQGRDGPAVAARPALSPVSASPVRGPLPATSAVQATSPSGPGQTGPADDGQDPASGQQTKPAVPPPAAAAGKPQRAEDGGPQPAPEVSRGVEGAIAAVPVGERGDPAVATSQSLAASQSTPAMSTAEEAAEAAAPASQPPAQVLREVSLVVPGRVSGDGTPGPQVEVHVVERTGEVEVAVRTADPQLNSSLRQDLPQLVSQLSDRGYRAETWQPVAVAAAGDARTMRAENGSTDPHRDGGSSANSGRGGSDSQRRNANQGQRDQKQNQPEWANALELSLGRASAPNRSTL